LNLGCRKSALQVNRRVGRLIPPLATNVSPPGRESDQLKLGVP
jgi:hypothetical protein